MFLVPYPFSSVSKINYFNVLLIHIRFKLFLGTSIERLCDIVATDPLGLPPVDGPLCDRGAMVRAGRSLLTSVTRVLLLADIVVVKQLLLAKDKVRSLVISTCYWMIL